MDKRPPDQTGSFNGSRSSRGSISHYNLAMLDDESSSSMEGLSRKINFRVTPVTLPSDQDLAIRPRVKFKMSASIESLEKAVPAKSPVLKSALKPFRHSFHSGDGLKKLSEPCNIPVRSLENGLEKKNSKAIFPEHAVVQLYHFNAEHRGGMWHEAARFIKYEQTVEGVDTMWSKPHVPFLTFQSVYALKKLLESDQAMCALDIEGDSFSEICHHTAVQLEELGVMNTEDTNSLVAFMTFRRDHAKNNESNFGWIRKLTATGKGNASMIFHRDPPSRCVSTSVIDSPNKIHKEFYCQPYGSFGHCPDDTTLNLDKAGSLESKNSVVSNSSPKIPEIKVSAAAPLLDVPKPPVPSNSAHSLHSMRSNLSGISNQWDGHNVPDGSECIQVLVGRTGIFENTKFILIRLMHPLVDFHLTKKRIPIRFIILIVGPVETNHLFLEMGRVFASMATNKEFLSTLYTFRDKHDLIRDFDHLMNSMTMLPPGKVDSPEVLSFEAYERVVDRNHLRHRKRSKKQSIIQIKEESDVSEMGSGDMFLDNVEKYKRQKPMGLFSYVISDFRNLKLRYISDFLDIKEGKMLAIITIISLYLCLLPPTITFAKILEDFTDGGMGITECLVATCLVGILWSFFSAQPLFIQSATGPVMIFEGGFYKLCKAAGLDYMEVRVYAGIIICLVCIVVLAFNGTRVLRFITGFIEEIFSCLIALIYIMETGHYIYHEYEHNPSEGFHFYKNFTNPCLEKLIDTGAEITAETAFECNLPRPNAGLMTAFVVLLSFGIAMCLYYLRFSVFLGRCVRNFLADFNVLITLIVTFALVYFIVPQGILPTLNIPVTLGWTNQIARNHGLIVLPNSNNFGLKLLASTGGGIMIFVLLVAETSMCALMLQQKDRKLEKPGGLSWDLLVMSGGVLLCSLFGLPWMCVAGVQTIAHAKGLSIMKKTAPGENPKVSYVVEQRITTLCVAILFGITTMLGKYLNYIPVACLFGVFLYSGMTSMMETTLFEGLLNVMHFGKHFRHTNADMNVTSTRIRFYRLLQLVALILIYTVKQIHSVAILFPMVLIILILGRQFLLPFVYSEEELNALDPEEEEEYSDSFSNSSDPDRSIVTTL